MGNIEKRIEALEAKADSRGARWIVLEVDGSLPDDEAAIDALLAPLSVRRHDTVVAIKKFVVVEGLPRVASVTSL
jgi:hypothetical protein